MINQVQLVAAEILDRGGAIGGGVMAPAVSVHTATAVIPIRAPRRQASRRTTMLTQTLAMPKESGVCRESPW